MPLPQRVIDKVRKEFPPEENDEVLEILSSYGTEDYEREKERVLLAILDLSKGKVEAVRELVDRAKKDYRDVLFWSEYPEESRLDTPAKKARFRKLWSWLGIDLGTDWESEKK
jgi:hypothetical protein